MVRKANLMENSYHLVSEFSLAPIFFLLLCFTIPVSVAIHPSNQTAGINTRLELECAFNDALQSEWYKDGIIIPNTKNLRSYVISDVTPRDIGYYFCRGMGFDSIVDTDVASVYVRGTGLHEKTHTHTHTQPILYIIKFMSKLLSK